MKSTLVIVHKPMFKKPFHIERQYYEPGGEIVKKDVFTGKEYACIKEARQALGKMLQETASTDLGEIA